MKKQTVDRWCEDVAFIIALIFLCMTFGCATSHQTATYPVIGHDGAVIGFGTAESTVRALGDSRQTIEKISASSGKTARVGASGMDQSANISDFIEALTKMIQAVKPPVIP